MSHRDRKCDSHALSRLLVSEMKRSPLTRGEIAQKMSELVGKPISERMLSAFAADSKELHRWPAEFDLAFCETVGSYRLLSERVRLAGFRMVGPREDRLIQIGRAYLQMSRAKKRLLGVDL